MTWSPPRSGRVANLGEVLRDRGLVAAFGDAGLELAEGPDGQQRVGVVQRPDHVDEAQLVVQPERGVAEAVRAYPVQLGVYGPGELGVGVGLAWLDPVADDSLVHVDLLLCLCPSPVSTPGRASGNR
jgi:hypothetical protein